MRKEIQDLKEQIKTLKQENTIFERECRKLKHNLDVLDESNLHQANHIMLLEKEKSLNKEKNIDEFIKVFSLNLEDQEKVAIKTGSNKRTIIMRHHLADITDSKGAVVGTVSKTLNHLNLLVEVDGAIVGIDGNAVINYITKYFKRYIKTEFNKQIANGVAKDES